MVKLSGVIITYNEEEHLEKCLSSLIDVVDEIIVNRMSGRRVHPGSGRNYHLIYQPPRHDGLDDETGEPLIQREDDLPDTVKHRLNVYHEETKPLVEYYQEKSTDNSLNYVKVDGSMEVQKVFEAIKKHF